MDPKDHLLQILADLRDTQERQRRRKLQKLTKPILIQVAEILLRKWERERITLKEEVDKRDYHIERLEALLQPKGKD